MRHSIALPIAEWIRIDHPRAGEVGEPREMRLAALAQQDRLLMNEALLARLLDANEADHGKDERVVEAPGQRQPAIGNAFAAQGAG